MSEINSKTCLKDIKNDVKTAVDHLFAVIKIICEDVEHLKIKTSKPDKITAAFLLDYFSWDNDKPKQNLEKLCGEEITEYMKWLDYYCKKEGTTKEQALKQIINGEI